MRFLIMMVALMAPGLAAAQTAPRDMVRDIDGPRTEIAVMATAHLTALDEPLDRAWLEPVLDRLEDYAPDLILIERLPGWHMEVLRDRAGEYPEVAEAFAGRSLAAADEAQAELGLTRGEAALEIERHLAGDTVASAAERRARAALFLAAAEPDSAVVQWLHLPASERRAGDGLTEAGAGFLDRYSQSANETIGIAAELAVRLGQERLYPIDSHFESNRFIAMIEEFITAMEASTVMQEVMASEEMARLASSGGPVTSPETMLALLHLLNSEVHAAFDISVQWLPFLFADMDGLGRSRVAFWEARNFAMASEARAVSGLAPGGRVLIVVGSAHKPFLDDYLGRGLDVQIVETADWFAPE